LNRGGTRREEIDAAEEGYFDSLDGRKRLGTLLNHRSVKKGAHKKKRRKSLESQRGKRGE